MNSSLFFNFCIFLKSTFARLKSLFFNDAFLDYVTVGLCFACSGYALFTTGNTTPRTIATIITCLVVILRYAFGFNLNFLKAIKTNKRFLTPLPTIVCFLMIGIVAVLTLFINNERSFFMSYVYFGVLVICSVLLCRVVQLERFTKIYCQILFVLCCISIVLFFVSLLSKSLLGASFFTLNKSIAGNFFFVNFQNIFMNRIQSIFWEPGVFASFLLIGIAFELLFLRKKNYFHLISFTLCLILTFSTAGYILLLFLAAIFIDDKIKNKNTRLAFELLFFPIIIILTILLFNFSGQLAKVMPIIFEKIDNATQSFTTRLYSPLVNLQIFAKNPFVGNGIHGANFAYEEMIASYSNLLDSQTSTTAGMMAKFGIIGIVPTAMIVVGIAFNRRNNLFKNICLVLLLFLIINKEPHGNILISWAIPFYFIYDTFDKKAIENKYSSISIITLRDRLKSSNDSSIFAKNAFFSIVIKLIALLVGFFSVPIFSKYFKNEITYGVWLTILSVINWVITFDLGFGNGMKNKLIKSLAEKDYDEGKRIVSSTYASSMVIGSIILSIGLILINSLNITQFLKIDTSIVNSMSVKLSFSIVFSTIAIEFVLKNISHILQAHQRHSISNMLPVIATVLLQLFAIILRTDSNPAQKLITISIVYCIGTLLPYIITSIIAFVGPYKKIRPALKYASFQKSKSVMSLGLMFFAIQLALLFLNSMDQFILSSIFGPESVVLYTKYSKYFHIIITLANVLNTIIWATICKQYASKDYSGLKKSIKTVLWIDMFAAALCLIIFAFIQPLLDLWLGSETINANYFIVFVVFSFTIESIFVNTFASILNGFQFLKPQAISIGICAILKIPLILLVHAIFPSLGWEILFIINNILWLPILIAEIVAVSMKLKEIKGGVYEKKVK